MFRTENALVLRETRYREADRILTVLTAEHGKLTLGAHGALSRRSLIAASTQQLTYSEFVLFEKNGRLSVREGTVRESFQGLREDLERFALGSYFAECLENLAGENQPEPELMQLGLNCLYALSRNLGECEKIKPAFEFRLMKIAGYAPMEGQCAVCGRPDIQDPVFQIDEGQIVCRNCRKSGRAYRLGDAGLQTLRHVLNAPAKKMLSFQNSEADRALLADAAEAWTLRCLGKNIPSLSFYRSLRMNGEKHG